MPLLSKLFGLNHKTDVHLAVRTHEQMKEVLFSPDTSGPEVHYYMIRGGSTQKNITVWQSGTIAGEYIKAYGHYHVDGRGEVYTVLSGSGILLLQERKKDGDGQFINDEIQSAKAIFVKAGNRVTIPPGIGHLMVNTGKEWLVTSDNSPVEFTHEKEAGWPAHADYAPIKNLHGFAYYVIERNGVPSFVKNPNYKAIPEIIIEQA